MPASVLLFFALGFAGLGLAAGAVLIHWLESGLQRPILERQVVPIDDPYLIALLRGEDQ